MLTLTQKDLLKEVVKAAYEKRALNLFYFNTQKGLESRRLVEPYAVYPSASDTIIRAYQLEPVAGWRFFHLSMVGRVEDAGRTFMPRRPISLEAAGNPRKIGPVETRNVEQEEYRKRLLEAIVDMQVTPDEIKGLQQFRQTYGLTPEEIRGEHYRVFSECLSNVVQDHLVTDTERSLLKELNTVLHACGAGLIE